MSEEVSQNTTEEESKLKLVLDSSYPLLQQFREKCPGTYKHGQTLASMVEGISRALNLDVDTMKVACLYHDIGKMHFPEYYSENQEDYNPHDNLDPYVSYQLITQHVGNTVSILVNDSNFPREIIDMVSRHHGNSVVKYFFDKSGEEDDDRYRYKGDMPKDIKDAVLMIVDSVEAVSRARYQAGGGCDTEQTIDDVIKQLMDDGQLNNVHARFGDLNIIRDELRKELKGIYQKRINYDEAKEEVKKE